MLAERFRAAGYETAGFFCCNSQFGEEHQLGLNRGIDHLVIEGNNAELSKIAAEWVKARDASNATKPLFVWIHMFDPHRWDRDFPRKKHGDRIKYRYDLALAETDRNLSRILDAVWSVERRDQTFVAVTSDHGEGLGDHDVKFHATTLYNTEMRVPLVVVGPGAKRIRVPEPVGLVDLAPTLLELAGFAPPGMPDMDGLSFADVVLGKRRGLLDAGEAYFSMVPDHSVRQSAWGLVSGRYKLIVPGGGQPELYDIVADPKEASNLAETRPELLEEMQRRLARRKRLDRVPPF
jgi:arylsulfatase A-like enzyme